MTGLRDLRVAFMGTPGFAVQILDAVQAAGPKVVAVYSQPPRPTGRGHKVQPSPVHARATALNIPVQTPLSLRGADEQAAFAALDLDVAIVAAYGLLLPRAILDAPRHGCINVHASLLPRWRGAAPIQRAILAGDAETGVTIMQMEAGLDTGPMLLKAALPIDATMTASRLHDELAEMGAKLIVETLEQLVSNTLRAEAQPETGVTYAAKLTREEGQIDWREPAAALDRKIRALNPAPGVWFTLGEDRIKILAAAIEPGSGTPGAILDSDLAIACGAGILRPVTLQRAGRGPVDRRAFLNGTPLSAGTILPCPATN